MLVMNGFVWFSGFKEDAHLVQDFPGTGQGSQIGIEMTILTRRMTVPDRIKKNLLVMMSRIDDPGINQRGLQGAEIVVVTGIFTVGPEVVGIPRLVDFEQYSEPVITFCGKVTVQAETSGGSGCRQGIGHWIFR